MADSYNANANDIEFNEVTAGLYVYRNASGNVISNNTVEGVLGDYENASNNTVVGNSITDGYLKVIHHANNNFIYGA
jgi:hypothetical protein